MRRLFVLPPLMVLVLCGFLAVSADENKRVTVLDVRMGENGKGQTRLVLDLDGRPDYLVGPVGEVLPEIAVHVTGASFTPSGGTGTEEGVGLIAGVIYGPALLRAQLNETALPTRVFVLPPKGDIKHHRLVIDLDPASAEEFAEQAEAFRAPLDGMNKRYPGEEAEKPEALARTAAPAANSAPIPRLKPTEDEPPVVLAGIDPEVIELRVPDPVPPRRINSRPMIVLDPGHGGREPGAVGLNGTTEDTITLAYAKALRSNLIARGYDVRLTRSDDTYVKHEDRIGMARELHADLFMSIHADAHDDHDLRGASVYTLSQKRSQKLENDIRNTGDFVLYDVEVSREDEVGDILLDLAQSTTRQNSDRLANALIANMRGTMPLLKNPKRRGALLVLLSPDVPAVLVELAFLSNAEDEKNLKSGAWRRGAVDAIADGVDAYFQDNGVEARLAGGSASSQL